MATENDNARSNPSVAFGDRPTEVAPAVSPPGKKVGRVGQRVGPFQLVERLSRVDAIGLYRATRPVGSRQPREVAVRIIEDARDEHAAAWVRHEYDILSRLDHPTIPQAYGYYSSQVGVAMSVPPSITLEQILKARRAGQVELTDATAIDIVYEVAEAIRHAHSVTGPDGPICHSHLHTRHIAFHPDGALVVLGFGSAPTAQALAYTPPEQVVGAFTDARSDQWRIGALMMELLLGTRLYADLDDPEAAAAEGATRPWIERLARRHPEAARVASRLLKPAAGSRYPTDNLMIRDLLELTRHHAGQPDRRALVSQMRAALDAEARRAAAELRRQEAERQAAVAAEQARIKQEEERQAALAAEQERQRLEAERLAAEAARVEAERQAAEAAEAAEAARREAERLAEEANAPSEPAPQPTATGGSIGDPPDVLDAGPPVAVTTVEVHDDFDSIDAMESVQPPSIGTILGGGDPTGLPGAVPAPARPRSLSLVPEITEVADPAMVPDGVSVAYVDESSDDMSSEGVSLGLDRVDSPMHDGPSLGPIPGAVDDPAGTDGWEGLGADGSDQETTEIVGPGVGPERSAPRPLKWFPSELAAMAAIGVATVMAIVFLVWRFG